MRPQALQANGSYADVTLRFLGTGSAFSKKYGNTSALLTVTPAGSGSKTLLIDCGRTVPDDMARAGVSWNDVDAIFISHLHGDHIYGLEEAGFMGRFVLGRKPHLILPDADIAHDLWEHVLKGTMVQGDDGDQTMDRYYTWETADPASLEFRFHGLRLKVYRTEHVRNKPSYGLLIGEVPELVYTADTLFNRPRLEQFVSRGSQAIFHDCQLVDYEGKVHASLQELVTLDEEVRSRILLMHYGDDIENFRDPILRDRFRIVAPLTEYSFRLKLPPV